MKITAIAFLMFASLNVSANDNSNSGQKFLEQMIKQVRPILNDKAAQGHNGGGSCKPQGQQCSQHIECCSNFCGRGEC